MPSAAETTVVESPGTPAAELICVSKLFGDFAALREVSVSFPEGSCTVLLGPNGAGKSTLLRAVAGLSTPTRGTVKVFGETPGKHRGRVAYMSHASMLYDELSAMENLRYFASLDATKQCDCAGSPEMALRAVGLDPNLQRPVGQYSQGMRQRTSFARVLQSDPRLLLLDEPFSNMDVASVSQMVALLADFRSWPVAGGGARTVVLTTHQSQLAMPLADTVLTLEHGRVVETAAAARVVA
jgi:ABC-type multidrug transport system ATPase subunit